MGSINKYHGTHALRERANKLHLGILIIRFEMPYNIWCEGCKNHIGMGVRLVYTGLQLNCLVEDNKEILFLGTMQRKQKLECTIQLLFINFVSNATFVPTTS